MERGVKNSKYRNIWMTQSYGNVTRIEKNHKTLMLKTFKIYDKPNHAFGRIYVNSLKLKKFL